MLSRHAPITSKQITKSLNSQTDSDLSVVVHVVDVHRPLGVDDVDGDVIGRVEFGHQVQRDAAVDEDHESHQAHIVLEGLSEVVRALGTINGYELFQ